MATLYNSFDGTASGTQLTTGNSGGAGNGDAFNVVEIGATGSPSFDNAQSVLGGQSCKFTTRSDGHINFVEWDTTLSNYYGRFYVMFNQTMQANDYLYDAGSGGAEESVIAANASNQIELIDASLAVKATSTTAFANQVWNRIEFQVVNSLTVGQIEARLFVGANVNGLVPDEIVRTAANLNTGNGSSAQHVFGNISIGNKPDSVIWIDELVVGETGRFFGPADNNGPGFHPNRMPLGV